MDHQTSKHPVRTGEDGLMAKHHIAATVNGDAVEFLCETQETLLDCLRDQLGLTGTKIGCDTSSATDCGSARTSSGKRVSLKTRSCTFAATTACATSCADVAFVAGMPYGTSRCFAAQYVAVRRGLS